MKYETAKMLIVFVSDLTILHILRCLIFCLIPFYHVNVCLPLVNIALPPFGQILKKIVLKYSKCGPNTFS